MKTCCQAKSGELDVFSHYFNLKSIIIPDTDMIFVKNFTQPDFQAKRFTPQKCVICDIFLAN